MKTQKFFLIAAAALVMGFASCTKEKNSLGNNVVAEGKDTYMTVSIAFPSSQTRATTDLNATEEEAEIKTVDVFVYTGEGAFSSHTRLLPSDFVGPSQGSNSDVYKAQTKVKTTTGDKTVYVGINLSDNLLNAIKYKSETTLKYGAITLLAHKEVARGANGFAMFSVEGAEGHFVEIKQGEPFPVENNISVVCQRLVAKVTVESDPNGLNTEALPGIVQELKWAISNENTKLFMIQGDATNYEDPNWTLESYDLFETIVNNGRYWTYTHPDFKNWGQSDPAPVLTRVPNVNATHIRYALENTSQGKREKEITRVTVRARFIPETITKVIWKKEDNVDVYSHYITEENPLWTKLQNDPGYDVSLENEKFVTFYAISPTHLSGTYYFLKDDLSMLQEFYAQYCMGETWGEYKEGYAYWNIFLNKNPRIDVHRWDVMRNDFYQCNIKRITGLGMPGPGLKDPENPPDIETNIDVDIEILHWNTPILSDYDL